MNKSRTLISSVLLVVGAIVGACVYSYAIWIDGASSGGIAAADLCTDADHSADSTQVPNKMLFISCGGFIE